ncbi:MAG: CPBP family glutamic-type intramembrane protease [Terracidiphilus sp.]
MTTAPAPARADSRLRAYSQFVVAVLYFFLAQIVARRGAAGLASGPWVPLATQAMLVFLLLVGYAAMGFWFNGQLHPVSRQGFPLRPGWPREAGIGLAVGWAVALACVLPVVLIGGIAIVLSLVPSAWGWLAADAAFFALFALAEEIAFRGYAFQRLVHSVGPLGASLGFAAYYAIVQSLLPGSTRASFAVSVALALLLAAAYLRTKALWLSWSLNFGFRASRALVFGLAVAGIDDKSPVVQGNPMGPFWVTGGGFGLDGTWITLAVLLLAIPVVFRVTRDLDFRYNAPVIEPAGIPVDLDAAARAQHEAAIGPAQPAQPSLVQIAPALAAAPDSDPEPVPANRAPDSQ